MFFTNINLWSVLMAAVVGMAIGFAWYSPWTFGKLWLRYKGWSDEHMHHKKSKQSMPAVHGMSFVATLVAAFVLAAVFNSLVVTTVAGMILTAFFLWLGFVVPVKFTDYLYGGDSLAFFSIVAGHQLVVMVAMSLVVGLVR